MLPCNKLFILCLMLFLTYLCAWSRFLKNLSGVSINTWLTALSKRLCLLYFNDSSEAQRGVCYCNWRPKESSTYDKQFLLRTTLRLHRKSLVIFWLLMHQYFEAAGLQSNCNFFDDLSSKWHCWKAFVCKCKFWLQLLCFFS